MAGDDDAGPAVLRSRSSRGQAITLVRTINLEDTTIAQNDTVALGTIPKGARVLGGRLRSGVTFGATATIAIGIAGATGKYKAAATFATVDQPVAFGVAAGCAAALAADEDLILTVAAAAAPTSDHYLVVEIDYLLG